MLMTNLFNTAILLYFRTKLFYFAFIKVMYFKYRGFNETWELHSTIISM